MAHPDRLASSRQTFRSVLLVAGLVCALPWLAWAEEDLSRDEVKQKLDQTEQKLQSSRAKEQGLTQDLAALAEERAKLNSELIEAGKRVQASEAKLSKTEAKLAELKDQADNLSRELEGLVTLENGIRDQRDQEKRETERLGSEQASLDRLLEEKRRAAAQGEAELADIRRGAIEQAQAVTDLNELIERLDDQIAKVEIAQYDAEIAAERALRACEQSQALATPADESVVEIKPQSTRVAFASPDRLKPALPFEAAKGMLRLPAQGRRVKRFGDADTGGSTLKGISLQTRGEARITAPADGWVVYAGEFRSYGQLLIINAGGGYHVLLAGMSRIDVSLGQFVLAGEPIAVMGNSATPSQGDDSSRPVLYVEFRKDGRPIDPDPWWAEASEKVQG